MPVGVGGNLYGEPGSTGYGVGFDFRYNLPGSKWDVGAFAQVGAIFRDFYETVYDEANEPQRVWQDEHTFTTFAIGASTHYNFLQGEKVNPFVGLNLGFAAHDTQAEGFNTKSSVTFKPEIGVELFRHWRISAGYMLSRRSFNQFQFSLGVAFGGGPKKSKTDKQAAAQTKPADEKFKPSLTYSVEAGWTQSRPFDADGYRSGFTVSGLVNWQVRRHWFLESGLTFVEKPVNIFGWASGTLLDETTGDVYLLTSDVHCRFSPFYFNVPLRWGWQGNAGKHVTFRLSVGPYIGVGLWGHYTERYSNFKTNAPGVDLPLVTEYEGNDCFREGLRRRFEVGLGAKFSVSYKKYSVFVEENVQANDRNSFAGNNQVFTLGLGYRF